MSFILDNIRMQIIKQVVCIIMFQTNEIEDTCHALDVFIKGVPHL